MLILSDRIRPGPGHYFYNDLSEDEVKKWSGLLRPQSWPAYKGTTTYAAYLTIPAYYLYCEKDQAFPYQAQMGLVGAAVDAGANIATETVDASHSPFLSMPERTGEFIRRAAGEKV